MWSTIFRSEYGFALTVLARNARKLFPRKISILQYVYFPDFIILATISTASADINNVTVKAASTGSSSGSSAVIGGAVGGIVIIVIIICVVVFVIIFKR